MMRTSDTGPIWKQGLKQSFYKKIISITIKPNFQIEQEAVSTL